MENNLWISGIGITFILAITFALHRIVQEQIKHLQERLEGEAIRLKDNTDKAEKRLDDSTIKAEERLKEETTKAETRLADSFNIAENRRREQLDALESKLTLRIIDLDSRIKSEMGLQFTEIRGKLRRICDKNGMKDDI